MKERQDIIICHQANVSKQSCMKPDQQTIQHCEDCKVLCEGGFKCASKHHERQATFLGVALGVTFLFLLTYVHSYILKYWP